MRSLLASAVVALLLSLTGCGPVQAGRALGAADAELEAARAAGAATTAPYEFTAAEAYLHQARLESGYARYESAVGYAGKARGLAEQARLKAAGGAPRAPAAGGER